MKVLFIVNPIAGKGKSLEIIRSFEPMVQKAAECYIEVTKARGDATEIARRYTSKDDYIVFAVGGDGTVNEVLNGIVGTGSSLAIIPTGSGNDFVRSMYEKYSIEELIKDLLNGIDEKIDIVQMDSRYFLNIASIGLDAQVVYNASKYKNLRFVKGDMAYIISLFKTILGPKGTLAKVVLDGREMCNEKILLLAAANGAFYGGGIHIVPQAVVNDGFLDVCLIRNAKLSKIVRMLPKLFKAKHGEAKEVEMYQAKEIYIEAPEGCKLNIDGEIISACNVNVRMIPSGITMRLPARNLVSSKKVYAQII